MQRFTLNTALICNSSRERKENLKRHTQEKSSEGYSENHGYKGGMTYQQVYFNGAISRRS